MAKGSKRQRKKQTKKQLQQKHASTATTQKLTFTELLKLDRRTELEKRFPKSKHLSYEELEKKAEKADKAKRQREARYKANQKLVAESGYDLTISKSMSTAQVQALINKEKRRQRELRRQEKNIKILMEHGLSREDAEEFKKATRVEIEDLIKIHYSLDKWVGVCWWDDTYETDLRGIIKEARGMTVEEKIAKINEWYNEAVDTPEDSSSFRGIVFFVHGDSKKAVENRLNDYKERGYAWRPPNNFVKVGVSNELTVEGVVDMMYLGMGMSSNIHRKKFYEDVRYFMKQNAPKIYDGIF